ncbi:SusC/RagA family TonB-linked outer membrane protein [Pleomorphovibrio marinus]|uniref:SusC/RagA family TonB-linked outer membrane protein n=1 Tax=Pleomorphovibrio marinus TaxID=2164132 RepID=UPI000E0B27F5|nr:SusC/RagA family TonB-linked outer membrane protein [Pleomorphovibrio marinus]
MKKPLWIMMALVGLIFFNQEGMAQTRTLTGTVLDVNDGMPIPGVTVFEKGTNRGISTDIDGTFSIEADNNTVLVFSFIGYHTQEIEVGNQSTLEVLMSEDVSDMQEVVVTALGIEKERRSLAYSISEVKGDDLIEAREINLGDQLQGRIAGVNVSNIGSGVAGSSRVVIRGNTSLTGNNQPLYVIDGVPMDNSQLGSAGMWGGVDWGDGLSSLNPDDIESLSVLKGNTAAALYGSRASNGVVLITTKKGTKRQGIGVEVNSQYTAERIFNLFDFQQEYGHGSAGMVPTNPGQGREFGGISWGGRLDGSPVYQFDGEQRPYEYAGDNFERFYRTGSTLTNTVALTGGSDKQTFRFSMSDLRNASITPNSGMNRQTATLSTTANYVEKLTVSAKIQYTREDVTNRARLSDSPGNSNATLAVLPPNINVDNLRGDPNKFGARPDGRELQYNDNTFSQNPWWAAYQFENSNVRDRIIGSGLARYDVNDWLYAQARVGMDWYTSRRRSLEPFGTAYRQLGALNEEQIRVREVNMEYIIGANKEFGDFGINAFFGGNMMERSYENLGGRAENFNVPFLHTLQNGANQSLIFDFNEEGINSLFGSTEFSYRNFLFLNVTARNDWFSTLPVNSNSILYPSVGGSFVFSDAFILPSWISFGKVRGSWAEVGGGAPPYQLELNYGLVGQGHLGAALARINQTSVPNNMLQPLTAGEFEVGFDIRFMEDRFGIDYAYYKRTTRNDIIQTTIPQTSGYGQATVNVGEVSNMGHEVLLTANLIESPNFTWSSNLNMSYNINDVESLFEDSRVLSVDEARTGGAFIQHRIPYTDPGTGMFMPGGYSVIMGRKHQRVDGQKVYDENGLPLFTDDLHYLGSGISPWAGGWNNNFRIGSISLGMLIDYKFGGSIYSGTNARAYATGNHKNTLEGREEGVTVTGVDENGEAGEWFISPNDPSNQGITTVQDYYSRYAEITENFVYDSDFIKLRQISIGYNIPTRLLDRTPITGMNVSLIARNLFILHSKVDNIDPESTFNSLNGQGIEYYGVPQTRSYGFNISMKF